MRLQTEAELARERLQTATLRFKAALSDVTAQRGLTGAFTLDLNQGLLSPAEGGVT